MTFEETVYAFLEELGCFDYDMSSIDRVLQLIFPDRGDKWHYVQVIRYQDTFYMRHVDGNNCSLEAVSGRGVKGMDSFGRSFFNDGLEYTIARTPYDT